MSISDSGDRIALSFPSAQGSALPGTTQVYDWNGSAWEQVGSDIAGEAIGDDSGVSLALSGDGDVLAIGADGNIGLGAAGGGNRGGHVRVYELDGSAWTQRGEDLDGTPGADFGWSVGLSADGTRLIAGGPSGGVVNFYVFEDGAWVEAEIEFFTTSRAGTSVAISADGTVGAVGSVYYRSALVGNAAGSVHAYQLP